MFYKDRSLALPTYWMCEYCPGPGVSFSLNPSRVDDPKPNLGPEVWANLTDGLCYPAPGLALDALSIILLSPPIEKRGAAG